MARSAAGDPDVVISTEAARVLQAFEKLPGVVTKLSDAERTADKLYTDVSSAGNAVFAIDSAEIASKCLDKNTASTSLSVIQELKKAANEAVELTQAAVEDAENASRAAEEASKHAGDALNSAESQLEQIDAALKALKKREKEPESSSADVQAAPPPPSESPDDESHSQSLPQDPPSSTSTAEKPSTQQKAGTTATDTAQSPSEPSEKATAAESIENNGPNTLSDARNTDSSVSPSWVRTPLLLVVGVLGLLAVC
ncbi:hypothetical protein DQ04_18731000 [Trypanosoma grayi]|uniref:hypothetical protein n=1 Tax=Trypanosoma grayi TaxID=71804 RepID=UPI0004F47611|nr:hypothetical protein DQ04_18731000 [Trypanosoma grayi]KEG05753.1 hypothetical protein DQ04_18731000 [Trypanosoma grayi]